MCNQEFNCKPYQNTPLLLACAKSRPLGPAVYAALRALGAAADMPAIEYRQAWALIGCKGLPEGGAACAMGKRSTLLRLEAIFAVGAKGEVRLAGFKEELTSIVDVVTSGNQDKAV